MPQLNQAVSSRHNTPLSVDLGSNCRATVETINGQKQVDLREFIEKDDLSTPGVAFI